mgnify:CR=1 FL=1
MSKSKGVLFASCFYKCASLIIGSVHLLSYGAITYSGIRIYIAVANSTWQVKSRQVDAKLNKLKLNDSNLNKSKLGETIRNKSKLS